MTFRTGYSGQKYCVTALDHAGETFVAGWTDAADGGALVRMIEKHPSWHHPLVQEAGPDGRPPADATLNPSAAWPFPPPRTA